MSLRAALGAARCPRGAASVRVACGLVWLVCAPALIAAGPGPGEGQSGDPQDHRSDALRAALEHAAARTVLPARCRECHAAEFDVWRASGHAGGFETLHRSERAKEIADRLGLRLIRRATGTGTPACLGCHYTPVVRRGRLRAGAGVGCESCHGPARDWIAVHGRYGVPEADFQEAARRETAAHRERRIAESVAAGMRRSAQVYELAAACFGCHTVPHEEIVNRGGHSTGRADFELVAWSDRIRHNFLDSYRTGDGRTNAERPRASKRVLYVVGRALAAEFALRGMAAATADDLYLTAMRDRAGAALDELLAIDERVAIPEVRTAIDALDEAALRPDDPTLEAAGDAVRAAAKAFVARADGVSLAALDPLWDPTLRETAPAPRRLTDGGASSFAVPATVPLVNAAPTAGAAGEEPRPGPVVAGPPAEPAVGAVADAVADAASGTRPPPPGTRPPPPGDRSPAAQRTGGLVVRPPSAPTAPHTRPPWREPPAHAFVGVPCGGCHSAQERWWRGHPHARAAARLRSRRGRVLEIAQAYGVAADDLDRGTATCMWCHGTITARPTRRVRAGVGCQRCHGAGADYLEAHQTASYPQSVALGLADLRDPAVQAATCAGCHYITDPALIDAGHPTGAGFDIVSRKAGIVHWGAAFDLPPAPVDRVPIDTDALRAAHARVVAARGPIPERTTPAAPPPLGPGRDGIAADADEAARPDANAVMVGLTVRPTEPERPGPPGSPEPSAASPAGGDGDPEVSTTLEAVRQHLEALARALGLADP